MKPVGWELLQPAMEVEALTEKHTSTTVEGLVWRKVEHEVWKKVDVSWAETLIMVQLRRPR